MFGLILCKSLAMTSGKQLWKVLQQSVNKINKFGLTSISFGYCSFNRSKRGLLNPLLRIKTNASITSKRTN